MSQPSTSPPTATNPILTYYQQWIDRTPYITRTSLMGIIILFLIGLFFDADRQLGNIPYFTINHFEIYRIITSPFVGNGFFSTLLLLFFYPTMCGRLESSLGSSSMLCLMGTISFVTNISFILVCYILYFLGVPIAISWNCLGIWIIVFAFITIECMQMPDVPRQIMFIPIDIPSKYFPLILYVFFSLFSGSGPELSFALAITVGYLQSKGYLDRFRPSSYFLEQLESPSGSLHSLSRSKGWVLAGGALGHDSWIPVNTTDRDLPPSSSSSTGGRVGGFPQLGTVYGGQTDDGSGTVEKTPFPGSGHKLSTGGGGSRSMSSAPNSIIGGPSSSSSASKETIAQRRLAALGAYNTNTTHFQSTESSTNAADSFSQSPALSKLLEMGFTRTDAVRALERSNGDLTGAMQILTS